MPVHVYASMKVFLLRAVMLVALALAAHADVLVEQNLESPQANGKVVTKVKGDQARLDMPSPAGEATFLMNFKTGEVITLVHAAKMMVKGDLKAMKQQSEMAQKASGIDLSKMETPKATGTTEKVGEWTAELYEIQGGKYKIWAAKDYPDAQAIKNELKRVGEAMSLGVDLSKLDVPGMTVKSVMTTPIGPVTVTLIKASQDPLPAADFAVPAGYNEFKPGAASPATPK
jgi:hypothetical protein